MVHALQRPVDAQKRCVGQPDHVLAARLDAPGAIHGGSEDREV